MTSPRLPGALSRTSSFHLTSLGSLWEQDYTERVHEYSRNSTGSMQCLQDPANTRQLATSKSCGNISYRTRRTESEISLLPDEFLLSTSRLSIGPRQRSNTKGGDYSRDSLESTQANASPRVLSMESVTLDECLLLLNDRSRDVCPVTGSVCCHSPDDDITVTTGTCAGRQVSRDTQTEIGAETGVPPSTILLEVVNLLKLLVQSPAFQAPCGHQLQRSRGAKLITDYCCDTRSVEKGDPLDCLKQLVRCKKVILDKAKEALEQSDYGSSSEQSYGSPSCSVTSVKKDGRDSGIASYEWNRAESPRNKQEARNREEKLKTEKNQRRRRHDMFPADSYLTLP